MEKTETMTKKLMRGHMKEGSKLGIGRAFHMKTTTKWHKDTRRAGMGWGEICGEKG